MFSYALLNQTLYHLCKSKMKKSEPGNLIQISKKNIRRLLRKDMVPENTQICLPFQPEFVINNLQPPFI